MNDTAAPTALAKIPARSVEHGAGPRPATRGSPVIMHGTRFLARVFGMFGIPGLRLVPGLRHIDLVRGLQGVEELAIDETSAARMARALDGQHATFLTPNHPEVFTDWMVDWELVSRQSFRAAFWAGAEMVNGVFGPIWRRHNLIPTGGNGWGKRYSVELVRQGQGVLLHPEGDVLWTRDRVHPCFGGVADLALQAAREERDDGAQRPVIIQPILYKSAFVEDVTGALQVEMDTVERRLGLPSGWGLPVPARFTQLQIALLTSRRQRWGLPYRDIEPGTFFAEQDRFLDELLTLAGAPAEEEDTPRLIGDTAREGLFPSQLALRERVRRAQKRLKRSVDKTAKELSAELKRLYGSSCTSYRGKTLRPEHVAESLKRIKEQLFVGRLTDFLRLMMPSAVGLRRVQVTVPEPIWVSADRDPRALMEEVHATMQRELDKLDEVLDAHALPVRWPNPLRPQALLTEPAALVKRSA